VERLDSGTHADTQNMKGLGLAICQELVSQMNGTLEVSSERGSGTTVYVTIPCQATSIKRKKIV
jgi:K+-sensing histidine kinase KdpD